MPPHRIYYRGRYWYSEPPFLIGGAFALFVIFSVIGGCNRVMHRTPAEQAAAEQLPITWAFKTCEGITQHAQQNGWNVRSVQHIVSVGTSTYDYTATKAEVTLTYHCGNQPADPPQNVCFKWSGQDCAAQPPRRM